MCNNIRGNVISKKKEVIVKDQIKDWLETRPVLKENTRAKKARKSTENTITYSQKYPLILHNGTKIHEVSSEEYDATTKTIFVTFESCNSKTISKTRIRRYNYDTLLQIEEFLENSKSICQLVNIDLDW